MLFLAETPRNTPFSHLYRNNNALALSEDLDEDSVQTLVNVGLGGIVRDIQVASAEGSLQHVLREEVVDHVINIFP